MPAKTIIIMLPPIGLVNTACTFTTRLIIASVNCGMMLRMTKPLEFTIHHRLEWRIGTDRYNHDAARDDRDSGVYSVATRAANAWHYNPTAADEHWRRRLVNA